MQLIAGLINESQLNESTYIGPFKISDEKKEEGEFVKIETDRTPGDRSGAEGKILIPRSLVGQIAEYLGKFKK